MTAGNSTRSILSTSGRHHAMIPRPRCHARTSALSTGNSEHEISQQNDTSRRAILGAVGSVFLAAVPAALAEPKAIILNDKQSQMKKLNKGIYEPRFERNIEKPSNDGSVENRFVYDQLPTADRMKRVKAIYERIKKDMPGQIDREEWQNAAQSLRNQSGTLRWDLNSLARDFKESKSTNKRVFKNIEDLGLAIMKKERDNAKKYLDQSIEALNDRISNFKA